MRPPYLLAWLATVLMAAATCQAQPPSTADLNAMTGPRVVGEALNYATGGITYQGYLARDANQPPQPAVLVLHERWGLDRYARAKAEQLAALGFVALAVDLYGEGQLAAQAGEAAERSARALQDWPATRASLEAAMARLAEHPAVAATGMAAIGYGFGGSVVMNMALSGMPIDAAISFHGVPSMAVSMPQPFAGRVQLHNGAEDVLVKRADLAAMVSALEAQGAEVHTIDYPLAAHGFTNPYADTLAETHGLPMAYDAAADAAAWQSALLTLDAALNDGQ